MKRIDTKQIHIAGRTIGGNNNVLIQSMCSIKTEKVEEVANQINRCAALGADLMRVSVLDVKDALAIKEIKKRISIPLIADIHFDHNLALLAIDSGADAIRLNPGNIEDIEDIAEVATRCKEKKIPIRIGVNAGSLPLDAKGKGLAEKLVDAAKREVEILEAIDFTDIVISLKASKVKDTIRAYRMASDLFPYPLHIGLTEAGPKDIGLIRSSAAISPLLLEGIGDTIRISLSEDPEEEVKAAKRLLVDLGMKEGPILVSCPTCGRTEVDLLPIVKAVEEYLDKRPLKKTIAVMGCPVNGVGEAKEADIGIAGGKENWTLFSKGKPIRILKGENALKEFLEELDKLE